MISSRRLTHNFGLQRAIEWATDLKKPLLVFEALRCGYRWASDRIHRFILDGMRDNAKALARSNVVYYPYVEPQDGAGKCLLQALSEPGVVVVTDEFPCFMLPRMTAAAAEQVTVRMEAIDSNGLLPLRATQGRVFPTAYAFRRFLQKTLPVHLSRRPKPSPLRGIRLPRFGALPSGLLKRWPAASDELLENRGNPLARLPIDHSVSPVTRGGGSAAAARRLRHFIDTALDHYAERRNELTDDATSGLSPYIHFGHVAADEIFMRVCEHEEWTADRLSKKASGSRSGWWNMSASAEGFLDQLITWRELGYNMSFHWNDYDEYNSLPEWALTTLKDHQRDKRSHVYTLDQFEAAETHDALWNAAQRQLRREGTIYNYLRMLWGKKILEWSTSPREALEIMIELNNKYALDGRDPNSYSGIFWTLGRYDRPWGPERPIFGKIRYMSSENTARKIRTGAYLERFA
jgi:deoxyribodipyrimidine photo-lyase